MTAEAHHKELQTMTKPLRLWKVTGTRSNKWPPSKFIRATNINEAIRKASKGKDFILVLSACLMDERSEEHG